MTRSQRLNQRLMRHEAASHFWRGLTFQKLKVVGGQTIEGLVGGCEDGVGAFLLEQISQACFFHQRQENPTVETKLHEADALTRSRL